MDTNNDWNFFGDFAGSLSNQKTGLEPDKSWTDSLYVSGCTLWLRFDAANSIAINERIPLSEGLQAASRKAKFQSDKRNGSEKYNDTDEIEWFLGFNKK